MIGCRRKKEIPIDSGLCVSGVGTLVLVEFEHDEAVPEVGG